MAMERETRKNVIKSTLTQSVILRFSLYNRVLWVRGDSEWECIADLHSFVFDWDWQSNSGRVKWMCSEEVAQEFAPSSLGYSGDVPDETITFSPAKGIFNWLIFVLFEASRSRGKLFYFTGRTFTSGSVERTRRVNFACAFIVDNKSVRTDVFQRRWLLNNCSVTNRSKVPTKVAFSVQIF